MVYLIESAGYERDENNNINFFLLLKIGFTTENNRDSRFGNYKTDNVTYTLIYEIPEATEEHEKKLHYKFRELRYKTGREWFYYDQTIIDYIKSVTIDQLDALPFPSNSRVKPGLAKLIVGSVLPIKDLTNRKEEINEYVEEMSSELGKKLNIEENIIEYLRKDPRINNDDIDKYLSLKNNKTDIIYSIDSRINAEVKSFLSNYSELTTIYDKLKILCEYDISNDAKSIVLGQIPDSDEVKSYYTSLTPERLKALSYNSARIKKELKIITFDPICLINNVYDKFKTGCRLSLVEIKDRLSNIYTSINYKKSPKATDILDYFEVKECIIITSLSDGTKKRLRGYELVSSYEQEIRDKLKAMKN